MSHKIINKYINDPSTCIDDNLKGFVQLYPGLKLILNHRMVMINYENQPSNNDTTVLKSKFLLVGSKQMIVYEDNNVGVICGGGGGHEPFAAGYVGYGMLNAAVSGSVFTSPPTANILYAIRTIAKINNGGILVIIPNYTGDCLNFGLAIEEAIEEGINVESVIVNDDCALISKQKADNVDNKSKVGARGLGGLALVHKISGAMACDGCKLDYIRDVINKNVLNNMGSMGCCMRACSLPGQPLLFELADDEMEMGVGVHGEAGFKREKITTLYDILNTLINKIIINVNINKNNSVAVLVNNLGGLSKLEENIIVNQLINILNNTYNINVLRIYGGHIMTSLEMHGVQITILNIQKTVQDQILKYLDSHTDAPGWPATKYSINYSNNKIHNIIEDDTKIIEHRVENTSIKIISDANVKLLKSSIYAAAQAIIQNEQYLNKLDSGCGDGDCGSTLKKLAEDIIVKNSDEFPTNLFNIFKNLSAIAENKMGGTSGAIYSLFFTGITKYIKVLSTPSENINWSEALYSGLTSILKYSKARLSDRTMLDVLIPVCEKLKTIDFNQVNNNNKNILNEINKLTNDCCTKTKFMKAQAGRAAYVEFQEEQNVDAGAFAVKIIINNIIEQLISN